MPAMIVRHGPLGGGRWPDDSRADRTGNGLGEGSGLIDANDISHGDSIKLETGGYIKLEDGSGVLLQE